MPVQTEWDNDEHTIIRMTFTGRWQWDEVRAASKEAGLMVKTVDHMVHFIVDTGNANWLPPGYQSNVRQIVSQVHANPGIMVVVCSIPFIQQAFYIFTALNKGVRFRFRFVKTLEEARQFLTSAAHC
jgi:hypothetical protein